MKPYLIALAVGLLVGVIYGLVNVRSPAPPIVALVGLLGILIGEQLVPLLKRVVAGQPVSLAIVHDHARDHVFGLLPTRRERPVTTAHHPSPDRDNV